MSGAERAGNLELASALAEEIARLEPEAVRHQQKRVEYAFRTNDRVGLIDAYLALADVAAAIGPGGQGAHRSTSACSISRPTSRGRVSRSTRSPRRQPQRPRAARADTAEVSAARRPRSAAEAAAGHRHAGDAPELVNLGDWLRDDAHPKDTRMVVAEQEPSGDEEADFADMLRKFKQGMAENVDAEDYQSHYDLAIAYKEMGLIDEAIAEFQKALGSPTNRLADVRGAGPVLHGQAAVQARLVDPLPRADRAAPRGSAGRRAVSARPGR